MYRIFVEHENKNEDKSIQKENSRGREDTRALHIYLARASNILWISWRSAYVRVSTFAFVVL